MKKVNSIFSFPKLINYKSSILYCD